MPADEAIRVKCVCVFLNEGRILVERGFNPSTNQSYYVPPGGAVEFGERSADAIVREIREEFQAAITDARLLGVCESFYTWDDKRVHEIVLVFDAKFTDRAHYQAPVLRGQEAGFGDIEAFWMSLDDLRAQPLPVYPKGLLELLASQQARS